MGGARFEVGFSELGFESWTADGPHRLEFLDDLHGADFGGPGNGAARAEGADDIGPWGVGTGIGFDGGGGVPGVRSRA